ncbi:PTS sugar transporter subunit IIC [Helcobacillus massiliensis]|uniref:PTS sugar transporter subunit IIC n=2 Tax=Helcobacillus massiliensis TaxID=521392 RepID=UPI0021A359A3|nr:PTS sugar transporter subunit IIC [Helcobacillus massiliensis]MCT1556723.1 PTS sugar transporter subunit IIC [Helcobacillus massiliensis]
MFDTPMTPKLFLDRVLNGAAVGIVVGLIPNAITGELFKLLARLFPDISLFTTLGQVVVGLQFTVPVIVGVLIGMQFGFTAVQTVIVGTASFVGSGAMKFSPDGVMLVGIGDLINTMITASVAVLILAWVGNRLGSLTVLFLPIIGGGIAGLVGILTLPYVTFITTAIGTLINTIAASQGLGLAASVLIAMIFAVMIVSPISTVAVALAIGITGPAAGAASLGIAAAAAVLMIGSLRVNNAGVTWSTFLGAMKMMMGNLLKYPIMVLPLVLVGGLTGLVGGILGIQGTPETAGFGHSGLVGPIAAAKQLDQGGIAAILILVLVYFVIPIALAAAVHALCLKIGVYQARIFAFSPQGAPVTEGAADEPLDPDASVSGGAPTTRSADTDAGAAPARA